MTPERVNRYRNSIEFPPAPLPGPPPAESEKEKIRFPSFESTNESYFHTLLNRQEPSPLSDRKIFSGVAFDLEEDAKRVLANPRVFSESERKVFWGLINNRGKGAAVVDKAVSIGRYKAKKSKRKMTYKIRYKVRQDLAIKRLRNKGKFIKSKKMDLRTAANMILNGRLNRGSLRPAQEQQVAADSEVHF